MSCYRDKKRGFHKEQLSVERIWSAPYKLDRVHYGSQAEAFKKRREGHDIRQGSRFFKRGELKKEAVLDKEFEKDGMRLIVSYQSERAERDRKEREKVLWKIKKR